MSKLFSAALLLAALVANKTYAQVKDNFSVGPIIGFGYTTTSGETNEIVKKKFNSSFNIGLRLTYSANPHWGFGGDLNYRTEGTTISLASIDEERQLHAKYIRIDPKAYYFLSKPGQSFRPKISFGPSFGFLTGGTIEYSENNINVGNEKTDKYVKALDFGLAGAIGFNYRIKSGIWLNVDATYMHGLLNTMRDKDVEAVCNRSIFLNAGVLFGFSKTKK